MSGPSKGSCFDRHFPPGAWPPPCLWGVTGRALPPPGGLGAALLVGPSRLSLVATKSTVQEGELPCLLALPPRGDPGSACSAGPWPPLAKCSVWDSNSLHSGLQRGQKRSSRRLTQFQIRRRKRARGSRVQAAAGPSLALTVLRCWSPPPIEAAALPPAGSLRTAHPERSVQPLPRGFHAPQPHRHSSHCHLHANPFLQYEASSGLAHDRCSGRCDPMKQKPQATALPSGLCTASHTHAASTRQDKNRNYFL